VVIKICTERDIYPIQKLRLNKYKDNIPLRDGIRGIIYSCFLSELTMDGKNFNPYTDFGFKKLFGEEGSKDLLVVF